MFDNNKEKKKKAPKGAIKFSLLLSEEQNVVKAAIESQEKPVTFIHGQAGTGKTLVAALTALNLLFRGDKNSIIITRPTVATEDNGFLPGSFQEKLEPWLVPIRDNLRKAYNFPEKIKRMEEEGQIEIVTLTHFRGRTFDNAICIIDEYQNLTAAQLEMCIGRLGKDSIMIFCGDDHQVDLKKGVGSATVYSLKLKNNQYVNYFTLVENHRHPAVMSLLKDLQND